MSDVTLLSGISGLSFDSPFPISSLVFSAQSSCSFCLVIFLLMVHSPDFFPENSQIFFVKGQAFLYGSCWQLGDDSWQVVCAACCHMALVFAIMHLYNILNFYIVSVHSFFIFFFNPVLINQTEWLMIPACPSLMCSFNRGNIASVCVCMHLNE